ncbi:MAG: SAM-dependent methyltransferase [Rhizobiaceae bacterium]|nr:SAM-dependent methyltransferase [Rhizobiaceae bacterium]
MMETPLEQRLKRLIATAGPIPLSAYMALCLTDPAHGYYTTQRAIGGDGDFITAPEISQMFGEIIGAVFADTLVRSGREPMLYAEAGPGRGTLARDILRTLRQLAPGRVQRAALIEISTALQFEQARALHDLARLKHIPAIDALPGTDAMLFVANEFLDALPVRQFVKQAAAWREIMVGLVEGQLALTSVDASLDRSLLPQGHDAEPDGAVFEWAPAREAAISALAEQVRRRSGLALIIDYGHARSGFGDTVQAVRRHASVPVLHAPGECDLTSHVDFEPLARIAKAQGCDVAMMTQGDFLIGAGLLERAGALGAGQSSDVQQAISTAVERLAGPQQMGVLFKVLAIAKGVALPSPFASAG